MAIQPPTTPTAAPGKITETVVPSKGNRLSKILLYVIGCTVLLAAGGAGGWYYATLQKPAGPPEGTLPVRGIAPADTQEIPMEQTQLEGSEPQSSGSGEMLFDTELPADASLGGSLDTSVPGVPAE